MKVAYFHHSGDMYGASKSLLYLITELKKRGVIPLVILAEDGPFHSVLRENGIEVVLVATVPVLRRKVFRSSAGFLRHCASYLGSLRLVARILRKHRIDLLHSNDIIIGLLPGILSKLLRIPHVWHIRTNVSEFRNFMAPVGWLLPYLCDALICISKTVLLQFGSRPHAKMTLVYNGLPPDIISLRLPYNRDFRKNLGIAHGDTVVCCIGRINSWKGQTILAEAFAAIQTEIPDTTKLLFVGDVYPGNERYQAEFDQKLEVLGIKPHTFHVSFVHDIRSVYEAIDILVVPSVIAEPFGLVVVEGMAYSCAILAANHGGPSEILQDQVTGLLYPPHDVPELARRLKQLVLDEELRTSLAGNARRYIEHSFSITETADRVYEIYQACMRDGSRE